MKKSKRVCLPISWACNSDCIFCMDDWNLSKFISINDITSKLESARNYSDEVTFSSLEPTLHPKLDRIAKIAKTMNFKKIEVVTNWRKLNNYDYTKNLIISWLNEFNLSIHSYNSITHDKIVRSKNAFNEWLTGLINLVKIKKEYDILINVSITVCKQNYKEIYKTVYFLEKFNLDNIILNILQPRHEAIKNKDETFVQYKFMIKEFLKLKKLQNTFHNIFINGLVPCLSEWLSDSIWYFNWAQINKKDINWKYKVEFDSFKKKRIECNKCIYYDNCEWVWSSYIDKYWWGEFNILK